MLRRLMPLVDNSTGYPMVNKKPASVPVLIENPAIQGWNLLVSLVSAVPEDSRGAGVQPAILTTELGSNGIEVLSFYK